MSEMHFTGSAGDIGTEAIEKNWNTERLEAIESHCKPLEDIGTFNWSNTGHLLDRKFISQLNQQFLSNERGERKLL